MSRQSARRRSPATFDQELDSVKRRGPVVYGLAVVMIVIGVALGVVNADVLDGLLGEPTPSLQNVSGTLAGLPPNTEVAQVVRVSDGDTVRVRLADDEEIGVRLVGIDAPESFTARTGGKECFGDAASERAKAMLPPGTIVYLEVDRTDRDRYGRMLRYIWMDAGDMGVGPSGEAIMLNEQLVREGFAIPYPYRPDTREQPRFELAATRAANENLGLHCACGGERIPVEETRLECPVPT